MPTSLTITLPIAQQERLSRFALRYGFSLPSFAQRILEEVASEFPEESLEDYNQPKALKASLARALNDWRMGRVRTQL